MVLHPFTKGMDIREAMEEADRLFVESFYEYEFNALGYNENERRAITHGAAVLIGSGQLYSKEKPALELFTAIASDEGVQNLMQCNEYQGEIWYNKEQLQRVVLLSALSFALLPKAKDFSPDGYISTLFEKEAASGYRLREMLKKEEEQQ